jgi:2,3-bisphosphoglycerate-dependent phosphoglycerate mutase
MQQLGALLAHRQLIPDLAYTSRLQRCRASRDALLATMGRSDIETATDWRLNERHYGALTGLSKQDAARSFGTEQVRRWRRSFDAVPPLMDVKANERLLGDAYKDLPADAVPRGESLAQVVVRVGAFWRERLLPDLQAVRRTVVVGHGNSLRALVKLIDAVSDDDIASLEVENGRALIYALNDAGTLTNVDQISSEIPTPSQIL